MAALRQIQWVLDMAQSMSHLYHLLAVFIEDGWEQGFGLSFKSVIFSRLFIMSFLPPAETS